MDAYSGQRKASKPTHTGITGVVTPAVNNGALTTLRNTWVMGYYNCIDVNEHTDGEAVVVGSCTWHPLVGVAMLQPKAGCEDYCMSSVVDDLSQLSVHNVDI